MFLLPFSQWFCVCFCTSFPSLVFLAQIISFTICFKAGLLVLHSLSFCLFVKGLICLSNVNQILAGQNNLGCRFFCFITLNVFCHFLLAYRVSAEKSALNLLGIPLYIICCFSLAAFNIFSLYLIFDSLINMCVGMFHLGFILYGSLCASGT